MKLRLAVVAALSPSAAAFAPVGGASRPATSLSILPGWKVGEPMNVGHDGLTPASGVLYGGRRELSSNKGNHPGFAPGETMNVGHEGHLTPASGNVYGGSARELVADKGNHPGFVPGATMNEGHAGLTPASGQRW